MDKEKEKWVISEIKEEIKIAEKDMNMAGDEEDVAYYEGMMEGLTMALETVLAKKKKK